MPLLYYEKRDLDMTQDEVYTLRAIELAKQAAEHGNEPFGALLVKGDAIMMEGENQIFSQNDPTYHAELGLIRRYCHETGITDLSEYTLYSSCEPCFMCSGGIVWAKVGRLVYSAYDKDYCDIRGFKSNDCSDLIFELSPVRPEVKKGVLRELGIQVLKNYFKD